VEKLAVATAVVRTDAVLGRNGRHATQRVRPDDVVRACRLSSGRRDHLFQGPSPDGPPGGALAGTVRGSMASMCVEASRVIRAGTHGAKLARIEPIYRPWGIQRRPADCYSSTERVSQIRANGRTVSP